MESRKTTAIDSSLTQAASGLPAVEELTSVPDVMTALNSFADLPGVLLLESALQRSHVGRYSFLTADPFRFHRCDKAKPGVDPFSEIRQELRQWQTSPVDGLPPFQGGVAGLLSYELGGCWEKLPVPTVDEFQLPAFAIGIYDWVLAWDHVEDRAWIISQGFPETDPARRIGPANSRLQWVLDRLGKGDNSAKERQKQSKLLQTPKQPFARDISIPQWSLPNQSGVTSNFSRDEYLRSVERVIEYIREGDIFQANLSQRLLARQTCNSVELYHRLRNCNPAPFASFFAYDDWVVISASPERFMSVRHGEVETRPIKGTRQRRHPPEADLYTRDELRESEKDQAENVMIVDLLRNDLSRVCTPGSISVPTLCNVETYQTVQHLVSEIRGCLDKNRNAWDLLQAVFPGGSITGAPKVRAMQIIAELEPTVRGPYCGSLFYIGFDGQMDSNILIRTFTARHGWLQFPVGGGIVVQSDPIAEYEETLHKAEGMLRALG